MTNPLSLLPPEVRLYAYVTLGVLALAFTAWQVAEGDWFKALGLLLGSLGFATATSNVPTKPTDLQHDRKRRKRIPR